MFGGELTEADIRRAEEEAAMTIRTFLVTSAILYLSPFAIEIFWKGL